MVIVVTKAKVTEIDACTTFKTFHDFEYIATQGSLFSHCNRVPVCRFTEKETKLGWLGFHSFIRTLFPRLGGFDSLKEEFKLLVLRTRTEIEIAFGELFARNQNFSDSLVGILMKGKKRKLLTYETGGKDEFLLQGKHEMLSLLYGLIKLIAGNKQK